jgi:SHS2 domain-containing protein
LCTLLEQAARGMYGLQGARLRPEPRLARSIEVAAHDPESLLVDFLAELLYLIESDGLAFDEFDLSLDGETLRAHLTGAPIESLAKEIKAVTYHNLAVHRTPRGLEANVVFDV